MNKKIALVFLFLFLFISIIGTYAQTDIGSWTSVSLRKDKGLMSYILKPIVRHNKDLSNYSNASIDIIVSRKLDKNWSVKFLERYWWLENGNNRNFWFFDVIHGIKLSDKIRLSQYFRWHVAQDIDFVDPNFLRWHPSITIKTGSKIKPYFGAELFYRIDGINELQRSRLKIGASYAVTDHWQISLRIWKQDRMNSKEPLTEYIFQFNIGYKL